MHYKTMIIITILLLATGCGGGENTAGPVLSYAGLESPATVTENNAKDLVIESTSNVSMSNSNIADNTDTDLDIALKPVNRMMRKLRSLRGAEHGLAAEPESDTSLNGIVTTRGSCGGESVITTSGFPNFDSEDPVARLQALVELEKANIEIETVFTEYCQNYFGQTEISNGKIVVQLTINSRETSASIFDFEVRTGNTSTMLNGIMSAKFYTDADQEDEYSSDTTVSVVIDETEDGITTSLKLENFRMMTKADTSNSIIAEYSGRIYQSEIGYLDISTPSGVKINRFNQIPFEGEIVFKGNGQVAVTFNANRTYDLKITTAQGETTIEKNISTFDFEADFFEIVEN